MNRASSRPPPKNYEPFLHIEHAALARLSGDEDTDQRELRECGAPVRAELRCERCGRTNSVGTRFCHGCGQRLGEPLASVGAGPTPARTTAPALVYQDRRRLIRISGDRETFIANCKWVPRGPVRAARTVLATSGDSLALMHLCWTGARDAPPVEIEQITALAPTPELGVAFEWGELFDICRAYAAEFRAAGYGADGVKVEAGASWRRSWEFPVASD